LRETRPLRCSILRGGTSRGVFFQPEDLPATTTEADAILLNVLGSPDLRQLNGLGGATSTTSKVAIVGPPSRPDADVDYTFAQVSVGTALVDRGGNCGNISAAVGPFAIDQGLVKAVEGVTTVRVHNTNTGKLINARVPVRAGRALVEGDYAIPGVPGTGARIDLEFADPSGSSTGNLLPTGSPVDKVRLADGRELRVSVVDAANPVVFVLAEELGMLGTEPPAAVEARADVTAALEEVRGIVAEWLGIVPDRGVATAMSPGLPKVGMVAPPADYQAWSGGLVAEGTMDLCGRLMSMQTAHRAYMVTGAICTAAAAFVEGSLVNEVTRPSRPAPGTIRIGHPAGVMDAEVRAEAGTPTPRILGVSVGRTARHILDGEVHVPSRLLVSAPRVAAR
jgi:methylitaconate Delta-isomerase